MNFTKKLLVLPFAAGLLGVSMMAPVSAQMYTYERSSSFDSSYNVDHFIDDPIYITRPMLYPAPLPLMQSRVITQPVVIEDRDPVVIRRRIYHDGMHLNLPFGNLDLY